MPLRSDLQRRIDKAGGEIKVLSKPVLEQKPIVLYEEWTVHFVSGSSLYDYAAHRGFKTDIETQYGDSVEILPILVENLQAAYDLVEELIAALPPNAADSFQSKEIRDRNFDSDEPIYVEIVVRKIYSYE